MGMSVHNDHIVKDVAEEVLAQGFAGETGARDTRDNNARSKPPLGEGQFRGDFHDSRTTPKRNSNQKI
jgi:hypothetical protein